MAINEEHLGDGLFVSFDGFQYKLRAPRAGGDHEVYLEPGTLAEFDRYRKRVWAHYAQQREPDSR